MATEVWWINPKHNFLGMAILSEKMSSSQQGHEPIVSPSPTLAPSLRHSTDFAQTRYLSKGIENGIVLVDWDSNDPENPMNWKMGYRRLVGALVRCLKHLIGLS